MTFEEMIRQVALIGPVKAGEAFATLRSLLDCDIVQLRFRAGGSASAGAAATLRIEEMGVRNNWPGVVVFAQYTRGVVLTDAEPAAAALQARARCEEIGDRFLGWFSLQALATVRARHGEPEQARQLFDEIVLPWRADRYWFPHWPALYGLVNLWVREGLWEAAMTLLVAPRQRDRARASYGSDGAWLAENDQLLRREVSEPVIAELSLRGQAMDDRELLDFVHGVLEASRSATHAEHA